VVNESVDFVDQKEVPEIKEEVLYWHHSFFLVVFIALLAFFITFLVFNNKRI
jgi:hypothetical protein